MTIQNPNFETAGAEPGDADSWTVTSSVSIQSFAGYSVGAWDVAFEGFELQWSNDDFMWVFGPTDLEGAIYEPEDDAVEWYELGWDNNNWSDELISTDYAQYNSLNELFEAFEREWGSNESYVNDWTGVTSELADYDQAGNPDVPYEPMERGWKGNEDFVFAWTGVTDDFAMYGPAIYYEAFDDFYWPTLVMQTI